jgi:hypothetical protein
METSNGFDAKTLVRTDRCTSCGTYREYSGDTQSLNYSMQDWMEPAARVSKAKIRVTCAASG